MCTAAVPLRGVESGGIDTLLDNVNCGGNESSLLSCNHGGINQQNCGTLDAAGVMCRGNLIAQIYMTVLSIFIFV
ncbi:MAG: hypothetical protein HFP76_00880 [Methylococcales symbiont of Iophon sp. n. MRB-2018]|nr:MAG: hypothetical protein HFP76_00880 [Methylococcales symbiont of Iophon sp. n. MRB-2018]